MILPNQKFNFLVADSFAIIRCGLRDLLDGRFEGATVILEENADGFLTSLSLMRYDVVIVSYEIAREIQMNEFSRALTGFGLYPSLMLFEFGLGRDVVAEFAEIGFKGVLNKNVSNATIINVLERMLGKDVGFVYGGYDELVWITSDGV